MKVISKSYFNRLLNKGNEVVTMVNLNGTIILNNLGKTRLYVRTYNRFGIEKFMYYND